MVKPEATPEFLTLFGAGFVANAAYVACLVLLYARLRSPMIRAKGYEPPPLFHGGPTDLFRFLGFVFSGKHAEFQDVWASRLVWTTRSLFLVGGVLTIAMFVQALSLA